MNNRTIYCPNCGKKIYFCLDEWGRTPFHLHCDKCDINIGATSIEKCKKLLEKYHKKGTQLEYYNEAVQFLYEEGKEIINAE